MQESDKHRILNFLNGKEPIKKFESWVYNDADLESRVGSELYFELIGINYNDKFVLDKLSNVVIGDYIAQSDFENFKLKSVLKDYGWYPVRCIEIDLAGVQMSPEIKNAVTIIEEFGGLKFYSSEVIVDRPLNLVEFLEIPRKSTNMHEYGLNKNLVCFAESHYAHVELYVDEDNKFYQLDNVVFEHLYEYKGLNFEQMMSELLGLDADMRFPENWKSYKRIKKE